MNLRLLGEQVKKTQQTAPANVQVLEFVRLTNAGSEDDAEWAMMTMKKMKLVMTGDAEWTAMMMNNAVKNDD
ncbi:hypothetical protein CTI12_AA505510 [Artemisia annua]|uniref:Uncharacterized protein n=1 Tax=Artemisia annua TaxID=35608 RepID=A0A2U1LCK0_ARTAN|nr:hypothetical protein CTI12_AA505510 [Artemisia annua]